MPNSVPTTAARTAGKAAGARRHGLTGVFNVLAQQHREAATLLGRAKQADNPERRRELWLQVRCELICHETAELSTLYPVLAQNPATIDIAKRHAQAAQQLEAALSQIDALGYRSSRWQDSLESLIRLLQQHAHEEEHEFFPRAQQTLGREAARALEQPLLAAREHCKRQLG